MPENIYECNFPNQLHDSKSNCMARDFLLSKYATLMLIAEPEILSSTNMQP
jgi:hypothetical protein